MIPFDITFLNADGAAVLNVPDAPQTCTLTLTNRTDHPIRTAALGRKADTHAHLRIRLRPSILLEPGAIRLAEQCRPAWNLRVASDDDGDVLELRARTRQTIAAGDSAQIRLDGLTPNPDGGSRPTRVAVDFDQFAHDRPAIPVSGVRLLPLTVSRSSAATDLARHVRTGSVATSGPFTAGFLGTNEALNDGVTANVLRVRVVNTSGRPVRLATDDDAASRLVVTYRMAAPGAPWGLLNRRGDHVSAVIVPPADPDAPSPSPDLDEMGEELGRAAGSGWENDGLLFRRVDPGVWGAGQGVEFELELHTSATLGEVQLIVRYEDLPDHADGDLVLLARLGPVLVSPTSVSVTQPLTVTGAAAATFHGDVTVGGTLTTSGTSARSVPGSFKVGGDIHRWYPVLFEDLGWQDGALRLEIFRPNTHLDGDWHGALMSFVECHASKWGHGADFWSMRVIQSFNQEGVDAPPFVNGFRNEEFTPRHIIWLRGATTYSWLSNHPARLDTDALERTVASGELSLLDPDGKALPFPVRGSLETDFAGRAYTVESYLGQAPRRVGQF